MQENSERWMELAAQATVEQDPDKLMALVLEINKLLEEKQKRLTELRLGHPPSQNEAPSAP